MNPKFSSSFNPWSASWIQTLCVKKCWNHLEDYIVAVIMSITWTASPTFLKLFVFINILLFHNTFEFRCRAALHNPNNDMISQRKHFWICWSVVIVRHCDPFNCFTATMWLTESVFVYRSIYIHPALHTVYCYIYKNRVAGDAHFLHSRRRLESCRCECTIKIQAWEFKTVCESVGCKPEHACVSTR